MADFAAAGSVSSAEPGYKFVPFTSLLTNRQVSLSDPVVLAMNQMDRQKVELPFLEGFTLPRIQYGMPSTSNIEGEIGKGIDDLIAKFPLPDDFGDIMAVAVAAILKALPEELISPSEAGAYIRGLVESEMDDLLLAIIESVQREIDELDFPSDIAISDRLKQEINTALDIILDTVPAGAMIAALQEHFRKNPVSGLLPDRNEFANTLEDIIDSFAWGPIGKLLRIDGGSWLSIHYFLPAWDAIFDERCPELSGGSFFANPGDVPKTMQCMLFNALADITMTIGIWTYDAYSGRKGLNEIVGIGVGLWDKLVDEKNYCSDEPKLHVPGSVRIGKPGDYDNRLACENNGFAWVVKTSSLDTFVSNIFGMLESISDDAITFLLNSIKSIANDLANRIGIELVDAMRALANTFPGVANKIAEEIAIILPNIGDKIGQAIATYLNQIMRDPAVQTQSVSIGEAIGEKIGEIFHNEVLPLLRGSGTAIGATIANLLEELWDTHIEPQIDEINEVFDGLQIRIDNLTGDVTDWIKDALFKPVLAPIRNVTEDGFEIYTKGDGKETRYIAFSGSSDFDLPGEGFLSGLRERLANRSTMDG